MITITVSDKVLESIHPRETGILWEPSMREPTFFRSYASINIWCSEHCQGPWFREKNTSIYAFEEQADALMFKLAFGG